MAYTQFSQCEILHTFHVHFRPMVENKRTRFRMVAAQEDLIGRTKCFDGAILFLPRKITDNFVTRSAVRETDGTNITITIKLVSMVQTADRIRLFNIIFRNVQRALELTQIGRNYYDSKASIPLPQHKLASCMSLTFAHNSLVHVFTPSFVGWSCGLVMLPPSKTKTVVCSCALMHHIVS